MHLSRSNPRGCSAVFPNTHVSHKYDNPAPERHHPRMRLGEHGPPEPSPISPSLPLTLPSPVQTSTSPALNDGLRTRAHSSCLPSREWRIRVLISLPPAGWTRPGARCAHSPSALPLSSSHLAARASEPWLCCNCQFLWVDHRRRRRLQLGQK